MKKQKKNNIDYWLSLNCDPRLCSLSLTRCQWMALLHLLFLLLRRPKLHRLQLHQEHRQHKQTTGSNAKKNNSDERCYSEQLRINKVDVSKEQACWKAHAWNDWHQKQSNKFLTSLPGSEVRQNHAQSVMAAINKPSSSIRAFLQFPSHLDS